MERFFRGQEKPKTPVESGIETLKSPERIDLVKLYRAKEVWKSFEKQTCRSVGSFTPGELDSEERGFNRYQYISGLINFCNGGFLAFHHEAILPGLLGISSKDILYTPITLSEVLGALKGHKVSVDNFLDQFPDNYRYWQSEIPKMQRRLEEIGDKEAWDKNFNKEYLDQYRQSVKMFGPWKEQVDATVKQPIGNLGTQYLSEMILQDYQDAIDRTLEIIVTGKIPLIPREEPLSLYQKSYYFERAKTLMSRSGIEPGEKFRIVKQQLIEEHIEEAKKGVEEGKDGDSVMRVIDPILEDAKSQGIDLSVFNDAARDSMNDAVRRLQDQVERQEYEARMGLYATLFSRSLMNAVGLRERDKPSVRKLINSIYNRAVVAGFDDKEMLFLQERLNPILSRIQRPQLPFWKKLLFGR